MNHEDWLLKKLLMKFAIRFEWQNLIRPETQTHCGVPTFHPRITPSFLNTEPSPGRRAGASVQLIRSEPNCRRTPARNWFFWWRHSQFSNTYGDCLIKITPSSPYRASPRSVYKQQKNYNQLPNSEKPFRDNRRSDNNYGLHLNARNSHVPEIFTKFANTSTESGRVQPINHHVLLPWISKTDYDWLFELFESLLFQTKYTLTNKRNESNEHLDR